MPYLGNVPSSFNVGTDNINNDAITTAKIADGAILNADVNAAAAIAGTKISPDFGSQNILTTGTTTAASLIPTSSTVPTNGFYLPAANSVAISTGGSGRLFIGSAGDVGIGGSPSGSYKLEVKAGAIDSAALFDSTNAVGPHIRFSTSGTDRHYLGSALGFTANGTSSDFGIRTAGYFEILTGGNNPRLRVTSAGLVGIGTSAPSGPLDVVTGSEGAIFRFSAASTNLQILPEAANGNVAIRMRANSGAAPNFQLRNDFGSNLVTITNGGSVGIGTTGPDANSQLHIVGSSYQPLYVNTTAAGGGGATFFRSGTQALYTGTAGSTWLTGSSTADGLIRSEANLIFATGGNSQRAQIDSSGRLLIGTSTARSTGWTTQGAGEIFQELTNYGGITCFTNSNNEEGTFFTFGKSRGTAVGSNTIVQNNDRLGGINFQGTDGSASRSAASIHAFVDGTPGANDMPGRLVFSTTADGASSPTERMRIQQNGFIKAANNGNYVNTTDAVHRLESDNASNPFLVLRAQNANYAGEGLQIRANRSANSVYWFLAGQSSDGGDNEFVLKGDGNAFADGSWSGGGADYAEYFEWSDANSNEEDRRGISVVLDSDKIREAVVGEDPIGVISGNPSVVGDAAWNKWSGKYLRDEFGTYIQEDYEVTDDDGNTVTQQRRKLNPAYNPDVEYISREQRPEWDCVGLMGKLRIRKGQVTGSRWIKMRDISDSVEEWLVR